MVGGGGGAGGVGGLGTLLILSTPCFSNFFEGGAGGTGGTGGTGTLGKSFFDCRVAFCDGAGGTGGAGGLTGSGTSPLAVIFPFFGGTGGAGASGGVIWLMAVLVSQKNPTSRIVFLICIFWVKMKTTENSIIAKKIPRLAGGNNCSWYRLQISVLQEWNNPPIPMVLYHQEVTACWQVADVFLV